MMTIKKYLLTIWEKIIVARQERSDRKKSKLIQVSVGDIMMDWGQFDYVQFVVSSRILDIEAYYEGDDSFKYQKALAECMYPFRQYDDKKLNAAFVKLIQSYKKNGYKTTSMVKLDANKRLRNGTHRCALNIYHNITMLSAMVLPYCFKLPDYASFYEKNLNQEQRQDIMNKMLTIRKLLIDRGVCFSGVAKSLEDINDLPLNFKVQAINKYQIKHELPINNSSFPRVGIFFRFIVCEPRYEVKDGNLSSQEVSDFKSNCSWIYLSHNCSEGKILYDKMKPYFVNSCPVPTHA